MTAPTVRLTCLDEGHAVAVRDDARRRGAPSEATGRFVTLPADDPGFLMAVAETAWYGGHCTDDAAARAIRDMSRVLGGQ